MNESLKATTSVVALLAGLREVMPIQFVTTDLTGKRVGTIIVDTNNGFCTVGAGNLAPKAPDARIDQMIDQTDRLARRLTGLKQPVLYVGDEHPMGQKESNYPSHCEEGTGEELLVPELAWLYAEPLATIVDKMCNDAFVGAMRKVGDSNTFTNEVIDWINNNKLEAVIIVGICTDICVMDFVLSLISARNQGLLPTLVDIIVYEPACATYDLPIETVRYLRKNDIVKDMPDTQAHPREIAHHTGLWNMQGRGAIIANQLILPDGTPFYCA